MSPSISEILWNAKLFNLQNWSGQTLNPQNLPDPDSIKRLFETIRTQQIEDYLLVGGIAMLNYIEGRNTQDIDLILSESSLNKLSEFAITSRDQNFARAQFENLQIDFLLTNNNLFQMVLSLHKQLTDYSDVSNIPIATPTGLIILKLYALPSLYRQGQFDRATLYEADITQLLRHYPIDTTAILRSLMPPTLLQSDFQEVSGILQEIQTRIQRERDRFSNAE